WRSAATEHAADVPGCSRGGLYMIFHIQSTDFLVSGPIYTKFRIKSRFRTGYGPNVYEISHTIGLLRSM
ncbi:hypothetical protein, partial [Cohnella lubricantis]|uniref:hypothetical protein n=1 Tax=Cohnella lubricantis TaxID=2163172 RepID=UPI0039F0346D